MAGIELIENQYFLIKDGEKTYVPNGDELYSVLFEDHEAIGKFQINKSLLTKFGIYFSPYIGELFFVIKTDISDGAWQLKFDVKVFFENNEELLSTFGGKYLNFAILGNTWVPITFVALTELQDCIKNWEIQSNHEFPLDTYFQITRYNPSNFTIIDRASNQLAGNNLSLNLSGGPPLGLVGKLYDYQLNGYRWLSFITEQGLGAIVADEMGLGKTIQIICLLIESHARNKGPNLVIAPATLLENWRREISKFAPMLKVLVHKGRSRAGINRDFHSFEVIISSYDTVVSDISIFKKFPWNFVVADEAQALKNPRTRRTLHIKTIEAKSAIAVTGTPVENSLSDLWSISDFIFPNLLGRLSDFEKQFPDTQEGAERLEPTISPLLLRRKINDVAKDLPEKIEIPQVIELNDELAETYEEIRIEIGRQGQSLNLGSLVKLRMFCIHPWLTNNFNEEINASNCSPKLKRLFEILEEIFSSKSKALIFTSFTHGIDLLCTEIASAFGFYVNFIDGRIPVDERQTKVDIFTKMEKPGVLVLNPKAAGTGLNITAANHVIHFNPEWNPATEDQASARVYRRGQDKPVTIHRLFYARTIEEVMIDRMDLKRSLAGTAIVGHIGEPNMEDLLNAMNISPII